MTNPFGMSPLVGITADDLTGAADTAAAFARPGAPVPVSLSAFPPERGEALVFAVTTGTRARGAVEAESIVRASVQHLREAGATLIYKKIDSNLRGHVGAELAAVRKVVGGPVLLAPAFPARGRTTRDGAVLIDGVPVAKTEMGQDPQAPVRQSEVAALLCSQRPDLEVRVCPLEVVRRGAGAVRDLLHDEAILVADAETDADLDTIAEAALGQPDLRVMSGCAGLAAALARRLFAEQSPRRGEQLCAPTTPARAPVLGILASASVMLPRQVAQAAARGAAAIPFSCAHLTEEEGQLPELAEAIDRTLAELAAGRSALLYSAGNAGSRLVPLRRDPAREVELVVEHLAHAAFVAVRRARPGALLVGGGSTAQGVLAALRAEAIYVDDEPLPGLAAGIIAGGEMAGRPIALKPGAAGGVEAVDTLLRYLEARACIALS